LKVYTTIAECLEKFAKISWTIGNFDGVHIGHRSLINQLRRHSEVIGVITFDPHPAQFFLKKKFLGKLFRFEDQIEVFRSLGVDVVLKLSFDSFFSNLSAVEFITQYLDPLKIKALYVGYDFQFGKNKAGDFNLLQHHYRNSLTQTHLVEAYVDQDTKKIVSTSLIKQILKTGDLKMAKRLLDRRYHIQGPVISGNKLGSKIGFPTANIEVTDLFIPKLGVYICKALIENESYKSILNIGYRPTVDATYSSPTVECHILNFNGSLYGKSLTVIPYDFLREEKKFLSVKELTEQIAIDVKKCKDYLYED